MATRRPLEGEIDSQKVCLDLNINPFSTAASSQPLTLRGLAAMAKSSTSVSDDRQVYTVLRRRAQEWYKDRPIVERGLHLFLRKNGGQLALTFRTANPEGSLAWHRTYAFLVQDPVTGGIGETDLEFMVPFDGLDPEDTFSRFCRILPRLDAISASFDYRGDLVEVQPPTTLTSVVLYAIGAVVGWLVLRLVMPSVPAESTQALAEEPCMLWRWSCSPCRAPHHVQRCGTEIRTLGKTAIEGEKGLTGTENWQR
jgi:hypothetical protein